ncbi:MAG: hypothetical protein AAF628_06485 [Planctomycetota bacterium]
MSSPRRESAATPARQAPPKRPLRAAAASPVLTAEQLSELMAAAFPALRQRNRRGTQHRPAPPIDEALGQRVEEALQQILDQLRAPAREAADPSDAIAALGQRIDDGLQQVREQLQQVAPDDAPDPSDAIAALGQRIDDGLQQVREQLQQVVPTGASDFADTTDPGDSADTTDPGDSADTTDPGDSADTTDPGDSADTTDPGADSSGGGDLRRLDESIQQVLALLQQTAGPTGEVAEGGSDELSVASALHEVKQETAATWVKCEAIGTQVANLADEVGQLRQKLDATSSAAVRVDERSQRSQSLLQELNTKLVARQAKPRAAVPPPPPGPTPSLALLLGTGVILLSWAVTLALQTTGLRIALGAAMLANLVACASILWFRQSDRRQRRLG